MATRTRIESQQLIEQIGKYDLNLDEQEAIIEYALEMRILRHCSACFNDVHRDDYRDCDECCEDCYIESLRYDDYQDTIDYEYTNR